MRPAALLTGLTGVVAVMVLVYVGLTALNLEPHVTFGDPNRLLASADTGNAAKSPVVLPAPIVVAPTPPAPAAPPVEKPTAPVSQAEPTVPAVVTPPLAPASKAASAADTAAPSVPVAIEPPMKPIASAPATTVPSTPEPPSTPSANPASEAATALAAALSSTAPAPPALPVKPVEAANGTSTVSEAKPSAISASPPETATPASIPPISAQTAPLVDKPNSADDAKPPITPPTPTARPAEETAKSDAPKHDEPSAVPPSLPVIPTPLARPEPPPVEEAKASPAPEEKPAEPAPVVKTPAPVEEASLPSSETTPAKQPDTPAGGQTAALEPNADLKPVDLSRPLAERAGVLTVGNKIVQLAGIVPTDPEQSCTGPNGKEWPCGTLARTALRAFLLGRTITCDVPDPQWKGPVTAECRFARVSLSDWLARNGWAEPAAGSPLMAAADEARKNGLGIYGNDPRKKHISTLAPTPPPEDPLNPI